MVELKPHQLRLRPRESHELRIESSILKLNPNACLRWMRDIEDNSVAIATFFEPTRQLTIESEVIIEHYDETPLDFLVSDHALYYPFQYATEDFANLAPYLEYSFGAHNVEIDNFLALIRRNEEKIESFVLLQRLFEWIHQNLRYQLREEPGVQSPIVTLNKGSGSCRDYTFLFMVAARRLGLAARFVSGYLKTPPSSKSFGATHAWAEVFLPGAGWKGFDPTNNNVVGSDHIPVAISSRPEDVPPVAGAFVGQARSTMDVGVWVSEI